MSHLVAAQTKKGFASCDVGLKWFTKNKQLVTLGQAQAGDIAFFQFDADATRTTSKKVSCCATKATHLATRKVHKATATAFI